MYADIRQVLDDVRNNWGKVSERYRYAKNKFFYSEDFIGMLLFNRSQTNLPKSSFIDYNNAFRYYHGSRREFNLQHDGQERGIEIPYQEIINFVETPNATIRVDNPVGEFSLPEALSNDTQDAFDAFLADRPNTTNNLALRVADLQQHGDTEFSVSLQATGYFDEVHTALSLDHNLNSDIFETIRIKDLTDDNQLPAFKDSLLVNHLGVFTALAFKSNGSWYFHMMPRSRGLGVYAGMLSSVGGVVEPPKEPITDLVSFMKEEIAREVFEETGLDTAALRQTGRCEIVPLSFVRELSRGGKPQFFFLTVLDEVSDKDLSKAFKSASSKDEFRSDMFSNITALDDVLSPEFSSCLYYAFEYLQKRRKLPVDPLQLP